MGAWRGLLFKEWLKTRWVLLAVVLIGGGVLVDLLLSTRELFEFVPAVRVWEHAIQRQAIFYGGIRYPGLVAAVTLAMAQFVPEVRKRRLRLLFHLPVSPHRALALMLAAGLLGTLLVIGMQAAGLLIVLLPRYPAEVVEAALLTSAPWFLGACMAYLATVLIVLEPVTWRRAVYAVAGYALVSLCFADHGAMAYTPVLGRYAALTVAFLVTPLLPAHRFKRGLDR